MITTLTKEEDLTLLDSFRNACDKCGHTGYLQNDTGFDWCSCYVAYKERKQLTEAGITARYWEWEPSSLKTEFMEANVEAYAQFMGLADRVEDFIEKGESLVLWGPHGLAKTALSSWLLKQAALVRRPNENQMEYKYVCGRMTMADVSTLQLTAIEDTKAQALLARIRRSDLLVIDEFDKEYKVMDKFRFSGLEFGNLFNLLYERKKSIVLVSNLSMDEIKDARIHTSDVLDRVASFEHQLVVRGESYRAATKRKKRI